jgi:CDP-paratose 2-epimerase
VRDCLHPRDLARLVTLQLQAGYAADKLRLANVSGGVASACSLQQLIRWCSERWGMQVVASSPEPRPYDLPWVVLDRQPCSQAWDWSPQISLKAVLEQIASFAEANPDWIALSA